MPEPEFTFVAWVLLLLLVIGGVVLVSAATELLSLWLEKRRARRLRKWWKEIGR